MAEQTRSEQMFTVPESTLVKVLNTLREFPFKQVAEVIRLIETTAQPIPKEEPEQQAAPGLQAMPVEETQPDREEESAPRVLVPAGYREVFIKMMEDRGETWEERSKPLTDVTLDRWIQSIRKDIKRAAPVEVEEVLEHDMVHRPIKKAKK